MTPTPDLRDLIEERIARLRTHAALDARCANEPAYLARLRKLLLVSDYACERLLRDAALAAALDAPFAPPVLAPDDEAAWPDALRRWRHAVSVQIAWRDANGIDTVEQTLAATSRLADECCELALCAVETSHAARHGVARSAAGEAQRLIVFGLGKHGGSELNFSSDIDLVFAYREAGSTDGARPLANEVYFQRLGQRLIQLLGEITAEGFAYRVDMRLRPFGTTGRLALSFAAMEHYYQREGRDWERYAWIKARPVAGDVEGGERLLETLRPFVYRRYLDYGAFEGLRDMKALIEAEVQRRDLAEHLKLGPGGIREIEFIVQLQQLIRAGREPDLRLRGLLPALRRLRDDGHLPVESADALERAYCFLRRLENRLQMLREEQTHSLPDDPAPRERIALGLDYPGWDALAADLDTHRRAVSEEFARVFEARARGRREAGALADYWRRIDREPEQQVLADAGFHDAAALHARLQEFAAASPLRALSAKARGRLDRVLPALLEAAARGAHPDAAAERALALVHAVLRRSSYLALLDEQPSALARLVEVMASSAWMAERICAHPLLLDDLLDARVDAGPLTRGELDEALARALAHAGADDDEARLLALNEFRQSHSFRIALATVSRRQPAVQGTRQLAWIAETVLRAALPAVYEDLARNHGRLPEGAGVAVLGYGSFGGEELGFGSDLDLVFLYDAAFAAAESDGARTARHRALSRARRAEVDFHARHPDARGPALRSRSAPAAGWSQGPAGFNAAEFFRLSARARLDLGAAGARACARDRGRAGGGAGLRAGARRRARPRARSGAGARRRQRDARAHAAATRSQRCAHVRSQAGRGRAGRSRVPVAGRRVELRRVVSAGAGGDAHAGSDRCAGRGGLVRFRYRGVAACGAR